MEQEPIVVAPRPAESIPTFNQKIQEIGDVYNEVIDGHFAAEKMAKIRGEIIGDPKDRALDKNKFIKETTPTTTFKLPERSSVTWRNKAAAVLGIFFGLLPSKQHPHTETTTTDKDIPQQEITNPHQ